MIEKDQYTTIKKACEKLTIKLPDGTVIPRYGQGTWRMAEDPKKRAKEIESLRLGIELGMNLIDTAEMYANGGAEALLGEAIQGLSHKDLFIVSKVYPHNAGRKSIFKSCENSIKRLHVNMIDLYLLHWRGAVPLHETVECMEELVAKGMIKRWGVSNFDINDMRELWNVPNGDKCCANQVLYHLGSRGIEYDLLPWLTEKDVPVMAYCPLAQDGRLQRGLLQNTVVCSIAQKYHATPEQILLRFVLNNPNMIVIPKAGMPEHALENAAAALLELTAEDYERLSDAYPAPSYKTGLDMS